MLYETERQKLASNPSFPGWPGPAQGEVWRDVLSSALLPPPTHKKVMNLTKMKQGGESTSRYVTLRQAAVRLNKTLENIRLDMDTSQQSGEQGTSWWRV